MLPLARVFAHSAQAAAPLAELLAQHGYRIQIVNPDEHPAPGGGGPCDLEVSIEQLAPAAAVERAQQLAEQLGCNVIVASGALAGLRPLENQPELPPREPEADYVQAEVIAEPPMDARFELSSEEPDEIAELPTEPDPPREKGPSVWQQLAPRLQQASSVTVRGLQSAARSSAAFASDAQRKSGPVIASLVKHARAGAGELVDMSAAAASGLRQKYQERQERVRLAKKERAAQAVGQALATPIVSSPQSIEAQPKRLAREQDWQLAVAGAAIIATVIMFALGVLCNSSQSSSPAVKVITQPAAKIIGPAVVNASTVTPRPLTKSEPTQARTAKPRPARASSALPASDEDDDVVVRNFARPQSPRTQTKTVAGVKQYSDLQ